MKFILTEYLNLLKEDQELDSLVSDLLISMNYTPLTKPKKGRQYGVDISAIGIDPSDNIKKIFLFVVKQGNLTRDNWDSGKNAVRQSMNEILETYISTSLSRQHQRLPKLIIVATNGDIEQTVNINWTQYTKKHSIDGEIEFDFWGTDKLVQLIEQFMLNETLFKREQRSLLLKTLAFLELSDYDLKHFYHLIESNLIGTGNQKQILKKMRMNLLCMSILNKWCTDLDNLRPAYIGSERLLLLTWNWMHNNNLFDKKYVAEEFMKLHLFKLTINANYFRKIQPHCFVRDSMFRYGMNSIELSLNTWDLIGHLSIIGISEQFEAESTKLNSPDEKEYIKLRSDNSITVSNAVFNLLVNNPISSYPKYDEHCIEICLCLFLLYISGKIDEARLWLRKIIVGINDAIKLKKFFPLLITNFEKLIDSDLETNELNLDSSYLLPILAEWCVILNSEELYELLKRGIHENCPNVKLLMWLPEKDTEKYYYSANAMSETGSSKLISGFPQKMDEYKTEMAYERNSFNEEGTFSFFEKGMFYLGFLASRHFRTYPFPQLWRRLLPVENQNFNI